MVHPLGSSDEGLELFDEVNLPVARATAERDRPRVGHQ
jgi:hypothetical protein